MCAKTPYLSAGNLQFLYGVAGVGKKDDRILLNQT